MAEKIVPKGRSLSMIAATVLAAAAVPHAAADARASQPVAVVVTDVGETAQRTMPDDLWRKLAVASLHARAVRAERGTALPDDAQCRTAHAQFAVLATFDRATRLPGLAQDPDRAYAIARVTVRDCATGSTAVKTVRIESDPLSPVDRADPEASAERVWEHAVRAAFARDPVVLAPSRVAATPPPAPPTVAHVAAGRVVRVDGGIVYIGGGRYVAAQRLRDVADRAGHAHRPIELVVIDVDGKTAQASVVGEGTPAVGDQVEVSSSAVPRP